MSYISQTISDYKDRFQDLRNYILYSLGYPVVRVELTDEFLSIAIIDAVTRYYSRAAHDVNFVVVDVDDSDRTAEIPSDIKSSMIEEVVFPIEVIDAYSRGIFAGTTEDILGKFVIPQEGWHNILDNFDMVGYYLFLQRMEDFRKLVGIDQHWDITNGKIYCYPADANIEKVGIVYKAQKSDLSLETTNWIKDWALAKTKHMLGTIRGKMSAFQTAGGNIAADGDALKAEAKEEMRELTEKLNGLQKPLPFMSL